MNDDDRIRLALEEVASRKFGNPHSDWADYALLAKAYAEGHKTTTSKARFKDLEVWVQELIEKGERYDDLQAHADKLADALEDSNREVHGDENMDIWFAGKEAVARYRDFTKEQP